MKQEVVHKGGKNFLRIQKFVLEAEAEKIWNQSLHGLYLL